MNDRVRALVAQQQPLQRLVGGHQRDVRCDDGGLDRLAMATPTEETKIVLAAEPMLSRTTHDPPLFLFPVWQPPEYMQMRIICNNFSKLYPEAPGAVRALDLVVRAIECWLPLPRGNPGHQTGRSPPGCPPSRA